MNSSNNDNLCLKCYINLFDIVADRMQGLHRLAMLLNDFALSYYSSIFSFTKLSMYSVKRAVTVVSCLLA